jgi:O-antigen ligase
MSESVLPKRWWLMPLVIAIVMIVSMVAAWNYDETAREILAKSFFTIAGTLASPFILETSIALGGLTIVLVFNEWRRLKDGPDWVEMEVKIDDTLSQESEAANRVS